MGGKPGLKEGINDGYLTPFKVKQIATTLDDYVYTSDDQLIEGEIDSNRLMGAVCVYLLPQVYHP